MVLDIPLGWCVESVKIMFVDDTNIPVLSVHSAERISNNADKTMFSIVSEDSTTPVVMNNTSCELYLRVNMTSASLLFLYK